jgi:hypothetical protein
MIEKLIEIIKYHSESVFVDFKSLEYSLGKNPKKSDVLKDISAMANHPSDEPKYILIGVIEKVGVASDFNQINEPTDQAKYQQYLDANIEPSIKFEYRSFKYEGNKLAAFIIKDNNQRPYLFKKNLIYQNKPIQDYKIGDGFIRAGTSSRKLSRDDFELIYKKRYESKDRKSDLIIKPKLINYIESTQDENPSFFIIDFCIENITNSSIGFDVECKVHYRNGIDIIKKIELVEKFEDKGLSGTYPQYFEPKIDPTLMQLYIEELNDCYVISRNKTIYEKYQIVLSQRQKESHIFFNEILLGYSSKKMGDAMVKIELILRSDEFKSGPLIKEYIVNVDNNNIGV